MNYIKLFVNVNRKLQINFDNIDISMYINDLYSFLNMFK